MTKPAALILACGDGAIRATTTWNGWSTRSALGSGLIEINDCAPNCAQGHPVSFAADFTLTAPALFGTTSYFTKLIVRFRHRSPGARSTVMCPLATPKAEGGCVAQLYAR